MFFKLAVIIVVLWLVGVIAKFMLGGLIHLLLPAAAVMIVIHFIRGRK